jgi:hypothetical protein
VRLKNCCLVELRVYGRSPVRGKDEMLPTKDGHRVLSNRIELRGILEVGGISAKPSCRKLGPIVCERECGGGGLHGHPDQDSSDYGALHMARHSVETQKSGESRICGDDNVDLPELNSVPAPPGVFLPELISARIENHSHKWGSTKDRHQDHNLCLQFRSKV